MKEAYGLWSCIALFVAFASLRAFTGHTSASSKPAALSVVPNPDILRDGDIPGAMRQAHELLDGLRERGWGGMRGPGDLMCFPDQRLAEDPQARDMRTPCAAIPAADSKAYPEIAFFTDLYVRKNFVRLPGDRTNANPEGFYIVGYRNGDVKQIPIAEVRLMPKSIHAEFLECFPGQALYSTSLPQLDYVAHAHDPGGY